MIKNQHLQVIAKPIGPICNLNCTYCFYLEKERIYSGNTSAKKTDWVMSDEVLEKFIQQKIQSNEFSEESFIWQGGEPTLLGIDYFRKIVHLQQKYANGKKNNNSIQTNGILLDDSWCEFFADNNFLIGISIDGPADLHDKYRIDKGGKATFGKVIQAIDLLKKHTVEFNTLTTIHNDNSAFSLEIYHFLKDIGSTYLQFIPVVERMEETIVSDWSVQPEQFGKFLNAVFDEWVRNDIGKIFVQTFDVSLQAWFGKPSSLCIFNETCGYAPAIELNGDIYSCDHFVFPEYIVGNILDNSLQSIMQSEQQIKFGKNKQDALPQFCRECKFLFACNGECPKNRFLTTENGEPGLNYLCSGYKIYFEHIDSYMKFMVNELKNRRSPSNVMSWIKEAEKELYIEEIASPDKSGSQ
jgi:serine-type anaerobic sulfatase-maturating enzyme